MRKILAILSVAALTVSLAAPAFADLYVSPTGHDTNAGTSADCPFKTLSKALAVVSSNETINLAAGTYTMAENWTDWDIWGDFGTAIVVRTYGVKVVGDSPLTTKIFCDDGYGGVRLEASNTQLRNLTVEKVGATMGSYPTMLRGALFVAWTYPGRVVSNVHVKCMTSSTVAFGGNGGSASKGLCRFYNCLVETVSGNKNVYLLALTGIFENCTFVGGGDGMRGEDWWLGGAAHAQFISCVFQSNNYLVNLAANTSASLENTVHDATATAINTGAGTVTSNNLLNIDPLLVELNGYPQVATGVFGKGWVITTENTPAPAVTSPIAVAPGGTGAIITNYPVTVTGTKTITSELFVNGANSGGFFQTAWTMELQPSLIPGVSFTNTFVLAGSPSSDPTTVIMVAIPEPVILGGTVLGLMWLARRKK